MKKRLLILLVVAVLSIPAKAQNHELCEQKALFSPLTNHKISFCEVKKFDQLEFQYQDENGNAETMTKSGEVTQTSYEWLGEFENRPSKAQIFKNYEHAVVQSGGEVLYNYATINLKLKKGGDTFFIQIRSDNSGTYSVFTLREAALDQEVFLNAATIAKMMNEEGQVNFYGIYFDTDKSEIKPESEAILTEISSYLKSNPSKKVFFVGHTDLTGDLDYNQTLSELRAKAVVNALTETYGIPSNRMKPFGVGPLSPISSNASEEGKAKNRRVVMVLSN